ncbi:hypothetical protein HanLR1_Chr02g0046761 [Helianthus annuus]|nr:hypothetical protein HanLR1_Chr02g0046761 [Helianthus annuus]
MSENNFITKLLLSMMSFIIIHVHRSHRPDPFKKAYPRPVLFDGLTHLLKRVSFFFPNLIAAHIVEQQGIFFCVFLFLNLYRQDK